jgi:uncharacterized membrane protein YqjE
MADDPREPEGAARPLADTPTRTLVRDALGQAVALVKQESQLAKAELQEDLERGLSAAKKLGIATVCGLCGLSMLLTTVAFVLAQWMAPWLAALVVAVAVLLTGALFAAVGWARRPKTPLERTRRSLKEDIRWIKERKEKTA